MPQHAFWAPFAARLVQLRLISSVSCPVLCSHLLYLSFLCFRLGYIWCLGAHSCTVFPTEVASQRSFCGTENTVCHWYLCYGREQTHPCVRALWHCRAGVELMAPCSKLHHRTPHRPWAQVGAFHRLCVLASILEHRRSSPLLCFGLFNQEEREGEILVMWPTHIDRAPPPPPPFPADLSLQMKWKAE